METRQSSLQNVSMMQGSLCPSPRGMLENRSSSSQGQSNMLLNAWLVWMLGKSITFTFSPWLVHLSCVRRDYWHGDTMFINVVSLRLLVSVVNVILFAMKSRLVQIYAYLQCMT